MASKLPPVAPPAPRVPGSTPTSSGQHPPYFRPSISQNAPPSHARMSISGLQPPPARTSFSGGPPPLPPMVLDKDPTSLTSLPEAPITPLNVNNCSTSSTTSTGSGRPPATPLQTSSIGLVPELGTLSLQRLKDTQDNVDSALDKFEGYRHLFDMASQGFRIDKDMFTVNVTLAKVEEFIQGQDFELLLTTMVDQDAQKTAKGFKAAYENEVKHVNKYLQEKCEVLNQMLKLFISTPGEKLSLQKDGFRQVIEESRLFSKYDGSSIRIDLVAQAEGLLSGLELQDGLIQQIQQATIAKDTEKLETLLRRATAASIGADYSPTMTEAHRVYNELEKQLAKKNKTLKKTNQPTYSSPFYSLSSVEANSSIFAGLNSVLPLKSDFKAIPKEQLIPTATNPLPGIDTHVPGISTMPNLSYFMDQFIQLPLVMYDALQYIRYKFGWTEEGIFRLSGNNDIIAKCLVKYEHQHDTCMNNGGYVASEQGFLIPTYQGPFTDQHPTLLVDLFSSPHDATNLLKRWLRQLDNPIIPFDQYKAWADTVPIPHTVADTTKVDLVEDIKTSPKLQKLHELINQLPRYNRGILMYLSLYLYCVSLNASISKMTTDNISIVIAPNLLRVREDVPPSSPSGSGGPLPVMTPAQIMAAMKPSNDALNQSKISNETIGYVLKYAPVLFAPIPK